MFHTIEGGTPAAKLPPIHSTLDDQLPIRLREHVQRLKLIIPVISVSVMALRRHWVRVLIRSAFPTGGARIQCGDSAGANVDRVHADIIFTGFPRTVAGHLSV